MVLVTAATGICRCYCTMTACHRPLLIPARKMMCIGAAKEFDFLLYGSELHASFDPNACALAEPKRACMAACNHVTSPRHRLSKSVNAFPLHPVYTGWVPRYRYARCTRPLPTVRSRLQLGRRMTVSSSLCLSYSLSPSQLSTLRKCVK